MNTSNITLGLKRTERIGKDIIKEYLWSGIKVVYINNDVTKETYEEAIKRLNNIDLPIKREINSVASSQLA